MSTSLSTVTGLQSKDRHFTVTPPPPPHRKKRKTRQRTLRSGKARWAIKRASVCCSPPPSSLRRFSGLTVRYNRTDRRKRDDDERHLTSATQSIKAKIAVCIRPLRQSSASRICHVRAKNHLGSRASGMQGSFDTGTAWPYCRPHESAGGEHAARKLEEREERVVQWEQEEQVGLPDPKWL